MTRALTPRRPSTSVPLLSAACQGWGGGVLPEAAVYLLGEPNSLLSQPTPRAFPGVLGDLQEPISLKDRLLQHPVPAWLFIAVDHPGPPSR